MSASCSQCGNPIPADSDPRMACPHCGSTARTFHESILESVTLRMTATGTVICNFALQHLQAAVMFRDRVVELEAVNQGKPLGSFYEEIRAYVSGCVLSSAACLEALINELFIAENLKLRRTFGDFDKEFWGEHGLERRSILVKYQVALKRLGAARLNGGLQAYRDAQYLVALRNALVHFKPAWGSQRQHIVNLAASLKGRFPLSPFIPDEGDFITQKCMSAGCVRWAVTTVGALVGEFHSRTKLDSDKITPFLKLAN